MSASEMIQKPRYWDGKFIILNSMLLLVSAIAAYLEYSVYPAIMSQPPYGETNLSLQLSLLTFRWNATWCKNGSCPHIPGVEALDFFQVFILAIVFVNISHYLEHRKRKAAAIEISG